VLTVAPLVSIYARGCADLLTNPARLSEMSRFDRRRFLVCGLQLPAAVLVANSAVGACIDPDELSDHEQGMRESLDYKDTAPQPTQACAGCSFFKPAKVGDSCGHCEILSSTVSRTGHCDSWTKRG